MWPPGSSIDVCSVGSCLHACLYSRLDEIDTALGMEKLESVEFDTVPFPMCLASHLPIRRSLQCLPLTILTGKKEEVLSGAGTSHRVNGIIQGCEGRVDLKSGRQIMLGYRLMPAD